MDQERIDQGWKRLESRIDKFVGKYLKNDYPAIEHKPGYLALLQLPPDFKMEEMEKIS